MVPTVERLWKNRSRHVAIVEGTKPRLCQSNDETFSRAKKAKMIDPEPRSNRWVVELAQSQAGSGRRIFLLWRCVSALYLRRAQSSGCWMPCCWLCRGEVYLLQSQWDEVVHRRITQRSFWVHGLEKTASRSSARFRPLFYCHRLGKIRSLASGFFLDLLNRTFASRLSALVNQRSDLFSSCKSADRSIVTN